MIASRLVKDTSKNTIIIFGSLELYRCTHQLHRPLFLAVTTNVPDCLLFYQIRHPPRADILPVKIVRASTKTSAKYRQVMTSIQEVGVPELSPQQMARMEKKTEMLARDIRLVRESYGKDTLNLVLACGYLARLFENEKVVGFLSSHYPDILSEFQKIVKASPMASAPSLTVAGAEPIL